MPVCAKQCVLKLVETTLNDIRSYIYPFTSSLPSEAVIASSLSFFAIYNSFSFRWRKELFKTQTFSFEYLVKLSIILSFMQSCKGGENVIFLQYFDEHTLKSKYLLLYFQIHYDTIRYNVNNSVNYLEFVVHS